MLKRLVHFKTYALVIAVVFVLMIFSYATVNAMILRFDQITDGGTISYDGSGGALIGSDILFDSVTGLGTPKNSGVTFTISEGKLNFITGANNTEGPDEWTFASGGSFTLTGTVTDGTTTASGTLLSGTFTDIIEVDSFLNFTFISVIGFGEDTKNTDLLEIFGIDSLLADNFNFLTSNLSANIVEKDPDTGEFLANVNEADIVNKVPDASIMFLLGPSLLCFGVLGRRKFKREG